jgi:hypothetical protein
VHVDVDQLTQHRGEELDVHTGAAVDLWWELAG